MTIRAAAPKRSTKTLHLSFGPIPITCSIFTGSEGVGVKRSEFVLRDGEYHPVGRKPYDKVTNEDVDQSDIHRLISTENGLVEVSDEEVETFVDFAAETAEVVQFLPLNLLANGHYVTSSVYQLRPQLIKRGREKVPNAPVERAFGLLLHAMRKTGTFALIKFSFRGAPRYGALISSGRLYTLMYDEEIREDLPLPDFEPTEKELSLVTQIVQAQTSKEPIDVNDTFSAKIHEYALEKAKTGESVAPKEHTPEDASTLDLESMLAAMLEAEADG